MWHGAPAPSSTSRTHLMTLRVPSSFATRVLPALLCTLLIFYGGLIRMGPLPEVGRVPSDKLGHAIAFGGLTALLVNALRFMRPLWTSARSVLCALLLASALGALLELLQSFTTYRSADVMDWVADSFGALLIGGALHSWLRSRPADAH
jgi:VanZ family protein